MAIDGLFTPWKVGTDGQPTEHTIRRWKRFGGSGAKLIVGGEAVAVCAEGRANPQQLFFNAAQGENREGFELLLRALREAHLQEFGDCSDLAVGIQLTHSGRFCKPYLNDRFERLIAYEHPLLPNDNSRVLSDTELEHIRDRYIAAATVVADLGFQFVDVKACHGYLMHELLGATLRKGPYGGSFGHRTKLLFDIIDGIREARPELEIVVRLSAFDTVPFDVQKIDGKLLFDGRGVGKHWDQQSEYPGFGLDRLDPTKIDLTETKLLIELLRQRGVAAINITAGSPYYNSHIQRPAQLPPYGAYKAPEHPLYGSYRQLKVTQYLQSLHPDLPMFSGAASVFQQFLPHVGQAVVEQGFATGIGFGRGALSYPQMVRDVLEFGELRAPGKVCRLMSECTSIVRHTREDGMPLGYSGCLPYDEYFSEERERLRKFEAALGSS